MDENETPKKKIKFKIDMKEIEKMMNQMIKGMSSGSFSGEAGKPMKMGFSIKINPNGESSINQFGNVKIEQGKPVIRKKRVPLVDVNYSGKEIIITAEMPGVEERELKISAFENMVLIDSTNLSSPYFKKVVLREKANPKSLKHSFNNGILEIGLKKK